MKKYILVPLVLSILICHSFVGRSQSFKAEQLTTTSIIILKGKIDQVFPLFGAFDEKKWADAWNPVTVFPAAEIMQEGLIFKTPGHIHGESDLTWVVIKFEPVNHEISYLVICPNRMIRINIQCTAGKNRLTRASVTYQITGLDAEGNKMARDRIDRISASGLKDWQTAINEYLSRTNH